MAGRLVVTTNKSTYSPYSSHANAAHIVVVQDGDTLELTITNSQADRDSASPLEYYYVTQGWYWARGVFHNRFDFPGAVFNILPDGSRAADDPRERVQTIAIPSDFSSRTTQFGASICIEAWPYQRDVPPQGWSYADRERLRVWVFSATAPMPDLSPVLDHLPFKLREAWASTRASRVDPRAKVSADLGITLLAEADNAHIVGQLEKRHANIALSGQNRIRPPEFYETYGDTLTPTFPGADADVVAAMSKLNAAVTDRGSYEDTFSTGTGSALGLRVNRNSATTLDIRADEAGFAKLGSTPTLRLAMDRLGRNLGNVDLPIRLIPAGSTVVVTAGDVKAGTDDTPATSNSYSVPASVTVPIGGRASVTITLNEPATEDTTFEVSLPDDATVELTETEVTIPEGATSATVYVEDNSDSGTEQTATVTVTPPTGLGARPYDRSRQRSTRGAAASANA